MRTPTLVAVALIAACSPKAGPTPAAEAKADYVSAAIADPARAADRALDERRMPLELVTFSGVKPGDKVADLIPGNGYFSRLFSKVVGAEGRVYLVWPDEYRKEAASDFAATTGLVRSKDFRNLTLLTQPGRAFSAPEPLDVVFVSQNYHDYPDEFMGKIDPVVLDGAVFAALKPGGCFIVIDHAAEAGSGMRDTESLHRIDPAIVRSQAESVGFRFAGESKALANPADDHRLPVFDDRIRRHTDRFALKFCKPA